MADIIEIIVQETALGVEVTVGSGLDGADGAPGTDGKSAYEVWLDLGNVGTEADFIDSLVGTGDPGPQGASAYQVWLAAGNSGTEQDFIDSLTGPAGPEPDLTGIGLELSAIGQELNPSVIETALGYEPADAAVTAPHIADNDIHVTAGDKSTWDGKEDALNYTPEDIANKQTDLTSADAAHYPNVPAVNTGLTEAQTAVAGIDIKDYTGTAGTTHTYTIQTTDVGKTLRIQANLDDVITLEVGNDIDAGKPITIRKEFEGSVILSGTGTMVITGDDVDTNTMTYNTGTYEWFQFIKLENNLIGII